jgi:O-antigen/teichoic acid export membrane protein
MSEEGNKEKKKSVFATGTTDDEKKKRYEAGAIIVMIALLLGGLFQALWMTFTPRLLGDRDMGLFSPLMFAFYGMATLLALGIPQTIVTFVSKHYEHEFEESLKFIIDGFRLLLLLVIMTAVVVTIIMLALGFAGMLQWVWVGMSVVFVWSIAMAALFWAINGILNGFQRLDLVSIGNIVFQVGICIASTSLIIAAQVWVWSVIHSEPFMAVFKTGFSQGMSSVIAAGLDTRWDVVGAVGGLGLGHLLAVIVTLYVVHKTGLVPIRRLFAFKSAYGLYGKILRFGGLTAVAFVAMTLVQNLTPMVVRIVGMHWLLFGATPAACEAAIGHFGTAMIFGMATMLITGIAVAVIAAISEAEDRGRHELMQHYYTSALSQSFAIIGLFILLFAAEGGALIELMNGKAFSATIMHTLSLLAVLGGSGVALLFVLINLYTGLKKPQIPSIITILVIVLMTLAIGALCFTRNIRMPMLGFIGPVWLGNIAIMIFARRDFGLRFEPRTLIEPLIAGVLPLLFALYVMPSPLPLPKQAWVIGANIPVLLGPYFFILWLLDKRRKKFEKPPEGADELLKAMESKH